jgi:hypothetical protein
MLAFEIGANQIMVGLVNERKHPVRTAEGLVTFFFSRPCRSIS